MGFTIEDMLTISRDKYSMKMIGGQSGWANSISWILLIEDHAVLRNFKGKDLAVTTGFGFPDEEKLLDLVKELVHHHASGLIINTGMYVMEVPQSVIRYCNENDFPLLTVPWSTELYDLIKMLSARIFIQSAEDRQISNALIKAIEDPGAVEEYKKKLLPYFDTDGTFQIALITTGNLDVMDTVDRRSLSYHLQLYLENITHNGNFFYYDSFFVLVVNALAKEQTAEIVNGFARRVRRKAPDMPVTVGIGSLVTDVTNLQTAYYRAKAAVKMALCMNKKLLYFDEMGIYRLLSLTRDEMLLKEMGEELLAPLLEHDRKKDTDYVETLESYLKNNGSIHAVSEELFTHRNTVIYRVNNIKKLLNSGLETAEDRMKYQIACMIYRMKA